MPNCPSILPEAGRVTPAASSPGVGDLRLAVIGCGSIGARHATNLAAIGVGQISVFDTDTRRSAEVSRRCGAAALSDLFALVDAQPHVAIIATPTQSHVTLALELAHRGCHLFIEKPLSHSRDGIEELCCEAERHRLITMVACNMRFHPGPATVHRWLSEGLIGRVLAARIQTGSYLPFWHPQQAGSDAPAYTASYSAHPLWGGAILDCIHEIDLATWYLGPARLLTACWLPAASIGLQTDGLAELILGHESAAVSSVHLNFVQRDYRRGCQIIGDQGTIYWDEAEGAARRVGPNGQVAEECRPPDGWVLNDIYQDQLSYYLECVVQKTETCNPLRSAAATLEIALAARERGRIND